MALRQYQELIARQKAMDLVKQVYEVSDLFPRKELLALTNQQRRSAVSVPSRIAEGQGRSTTADFLRHLAIARESPQEMEPQILIACRPGSIKEPDQPALIDGIPEVGRLLGGLYRSLSRRNSP